MTSLRRALSMHLSNVALSKVDRHSRFCAADGGGWVALLPYFWPHWQPSMFEQAGALIDHAPSVFSTSQGQFALRYFVQGDLSKMERLCLEQAALCTLKEAREALLQVARDYHTAAEAQRRASIW